jgi:glycopeptide antibiotics resistance protein
MKKAQYQKYRLALLIGMVLIIPLGYSVRFATGLGSPMFQDVFGSIAYQILLMFVVAFFSPRMNLIKIAIGVFILSSAIEVLQLWQPPFLQAIRATWTGRVLLGNTFLWADFPPYGIGCFLGWLCLKGLRRKIAPVLAD